MDETTFRILDALTRDLGRPTSINELTGKIRKLYKTAHYKNIYDKIQGLKRQDILKLERIGKSSIIWLNFNNYRLTEMLGEMEKEKKWKILEDKEKIKKIVMDLEEHFRSYIIYSVIMANPEDNIALNRMELLILLPNKQIGEWRKNGEPDNSMTSFYENQSGEICLIIDGMEKYYNMKLDCLVLYEEEFKELLNSDEANPVKEMLPDHIAIMGPDDFWVAIKIALMEGIKIKREEGINPAKISEMDLIYNLSRFGYREMGSEIKRGRDICLEYIITSILIGGDARRVEAIPVLLAKNRPRYGLLLFLCKKYGKLGKLLGLLKTLDKIIKSKEAGNAIKIMEKMKVKEEPTDEKAIRQKMRLYHAI